MFALRIITRRKWKIQIKKRRWINFDESSSLNCLLKRAHLIISCLILLIHNQSIYSWDDYLSSLALINSLFHLFSVIANLKPLSLFLYLILDFLEAQILFNQNSLERLVPYAASCSQLTKEEKEYDWEKGYEM